LSPRHRDLLLVVLAAAALYLPGLGRHDLWNPDEARYAQVAREMRQGSGLLVPHLNGEVYAQKPPLLFWSIAAVSAPWGRVTETAARLPSALAGIAAVALTFLIARRFFGRRAAWLAAAAFATCFKTVWQARFGQIDMLLAALVAAAVWCWVRGHTEDRPNLYPLFFLFTGLATLAKGPVGLLPPLLAVTAYHALGREWEALRRLRVGWGLLLWAAVVALWLVPAGIAGGADYFETLVLRQNITRFAEPWHHQQPWYYYLTVVPGDFFPWSLLLPAAAVAGWRSLRQRGVGADVEGGPEAELAGRGFRFALCWVIVTLVFFSLSPGKRTVYVFTMYPGMALLVGAGLDRLAAAWGGAGARPARGSGPSRAWLLAPLVLLALGCATALAAVATVGMDRPEVALLGTRVPIAVMAVVTGLLAASLVGLATVWRWQVVPGAAALAAAMALLPGVAAFVVLPAFDVFKSARPLARELVSRTPPGTPFGIVPHLDNTFVFYTGRRAVPLGSQEEVRAYLARPGRAWVLAESDDLARLALAELPLVEVAADPSGDEHAYVLLAEEE
jgi:4-amino-4-deoxy-L-arabinose transferase-like glycosyltransferase